MVHEGALTLVTHVKELLTFPRRGRLGYGRFALETLLEIRSTVAVELAQTLLKEFPLESWTQPWFKHFFSECAAADAERKRPTFMVPFLQIDRAHDLLALLQGGAARENEEKPAFTTALAAFKAEMGGEGGGEGDGEDNSEGEGEGDGEGERESGRGDEAKPSLFVGDPFQAETIAATLETTATEEARIEEWNGKQIVLQKVVHESNAVELPLCYYVYCPFVAAYPQQPFFMMPQQPWFLMPQHFVCLGGPEAAQT